MSEGKQGKVIDRVDVLARVEEYNRLAEDLESKLRGSPNLLGWLVGRLPTAIPAPSFPTWEDLASELDRFQVKATLRINGRLASAQVSVNRDIVTDTDLDIVGILARQVAEQFARFILYPPEETPET